MKKTATALLCGSILCAVVLGACGAPATERFEAAKQSFDNYTAHVVMEVIVGSSYTYHYDTLLEVDGTKGKADMTRDNTTQTVYFKEEQGGLYSYANSRNGWVTEYYHSIEEAVADKNYCYLEIFQSVFFDEAEPNGDYYRLKESVLATYSQMVGFTITSAQVKLSGNKFTAAEVVGSNSGGGRFHISYTFSKYGKTSVTLPQ